MRIAAPPTTNPCFYGIDTPERDKLLASRYDVAGMAKFIGVDLLAFVSIDGLYRAMGMPAAATPTQPGLLRRLLHRRLPDPARRPDGRRGPPALLPRRDRPEACSLTTAASAGLAGRHGQPSRWSPAPRAAWARQPRSPLPTKARIACWSPAPSAASRRWTTGSRRMGGSATLVPLDVTDGPGIDRLGAALYERFGTSRRAVGQRRRCWARCRRSAISSPRSSSR